MPYDYAGCATVPLRVIYVNENNVCKLCPIQKAVQAKSLLQCEWARLHYCRLNRQMLVNVLFFATSQIKENENGLVLQHGLHIWTAQTKE